MKHKDTSGAPYQEGDLVTTAYYDFDAHIVRRVTAVVRSERSQSGWVVAADAGIPCPTCGRAARCEVKLIDSKWYQRADAQS